MMRKHLFRLFAVSCIFAMGAVANGYAADPGVPTLNVKIPFDFIVGGKTLPSGSYTVASASELDPRIIEIKNVYGHGSAFTMSSSTQAKPETEVIATWRLGTPPGYVYSGDQLAQFTPAQPMADIENFVVFSKYGDQFFLSSLWMQDNDIMLKFPEGQREHELGAASISPEGRTVVLAAAVVR